MRAKSKVLGTNYTVDELVLPNSQCVWWTEWYALNNSHPASQLYYDSLYAQYAEWRLDFIKVTHHTSHHSALTSQQTSTLATPPSLSSPAHLNH